MDSDAAIVPTEALAPDTRSLNEIADSAWRHVAEMESSRDNWNQAVIALGEDLIEARERHLDNQGFGAWLSSHKYFGFSRQWLHTIRTAIEYVVVNPVDNANSVEPLRIKELAKKATAGKREQQRDEKREATAGLPPEKRYRSYVADITELHHKVTGPVDVIVTDPPYPKDYLWTFGELSRQAKALLKPGGFCVVMSGQSYLPEVMANLGEHLDWYWQGSYDTPGQSANIRHRNVVTQQKPILIYANGETDRWVRSDKYRSDRNDKDWHHWGQSVAGMADIIERLTEPGDTILDPFVGGGATAIAALATDRNVIVSDVDEEQVELTSARVSEWWNATD